MCNAPHFNAHLWYVNIDCFITFTWQQSVDVSHQRGKLEFLSVIQNSEVDILDQYSQKPREHPSGREKAIRNLCGFQIMKGQPAYFP